jgi:heavy metal sensor kinase
LAALKKWRSISFRLTCWFSGVFLAGFIAFGVTVWLDLAIQLSRGRDRTLSRRAMRCFDLLKSTWNDDTARRARKFEEFTDAMPEGNLILVHDAHGEREYADPASPTTFPWPAPASTPGDRYENKVWESRLYRVLTRNMAVGSHPITIQVGGQLEDNRQLLDRFQTGLEAATPVLLVVSALCGYFLSRRALQPVDRMISGVRAISVRDLSGRVPVHPTGDELQRLAETCNDMLARVEGAVSRINRFTADASHELRNPISFVRTVSEYALQHHTLDEETRQAFEDIVAESTEAGALLEDMLTLARADEGRLAVNLSPLDLAELLDEVCGKVAALAEARRQTFTCRFDMPRPVWIEGDRASLRRLFWALLDNAVKYTPVGGRIGVELRQRDAGISVTVRDNGMGIPKNLLPRVFERFFRADPSRGQAGGTGLGLAIAKWTADAHHAAISVESAEGEGTTFDVAFNAIAPVELDV